MTQKLTFDSAQTLENLSSKYFEFVAAEQMVAPFEGMHSRELSSPFEMHPQFDEVFRDGHIKSCRASYDR